MADRRGRSFAPLPPEIVRVRLAAIVSERRRSRAGETMPKRIQLRRSRGSMKQYVQSARGRQALAWIDYARREVENGKDAIPALDTAIAALRIEAGELSDADLDIDALPDED